MPGAAGEEHALLLAEEEEEEAEEEREEYLLVERMTYIAGVEEASGALVQRLSNYSAHSGKRRLTAHAPEPHLVPTSVLVVFVFAALTMWGDCIIDFILYYLILDHGWDSELYGTITAIQKFVPVVMNPFWVAMAEVVGLKTVYIAAVLFAADGILLLSFSTLKVSFGWGAILAACQAIRPLRTSYVLMATHRDIRTQCMAWLNFSTDSMRMLGALTAKFWDRVMPVTKFTAADHHRMAALTSFALCLANVVVMAAFFHNEAPHLGQKKAVRRKVKWTRRIEIRRAGELVTTIDGERHVLLISMLTSAYFFLHSFTCAVFFVSNMPVLATVFALEEEYVQNIKLIQELVAIPAPLLIVWLNHLNDRTLLLIGFAINVVGILVFSLPSFHSAMQPLFGMILMRAAQPFFYTPSCSGFSKMMGIRSTGYTMALLTSICALGTSLGSVWGADFALKCYGSWWFLLSAVPSLIAMGIVFTPCHFQRMADDDPVTMAVLRQWQHDEEQSRALSGPRESLPNGVDRTTGHS